MTLTLLREPATGSLSEWIADRVREPMPRGAVLFHAPSWTFQAPGGGENQLLQTARSLENLGHVVRPFCSWTDRLEDARLLHLFGMSREGLELARVARACKLPVVLSPICWVETRAIAALAGDPAHAVWNLAKWATRWMSPVGMGWRNQLLRLCDMILPNSHAEARQLVRLFGADPRRNRVVPNGVDARFEAGDPMWFQARYGADPFVLYVGRIEPRKNVLGLIRAVRPMEYPLVVLGSVVPGHEPYDEACRREGQGFTRFLPRLEHDDPLLASAYAAARVFALPSWFETPGLAALEAAMAGCAAVVTPFGSTREYFGELVEYARPDRPRQVVQAIARAWNAGSPPALARHVRTRFVWQEVARLTAEAYARIGS